MQIEKQEGELYKHLITHKSVSYHIHAVENQKKTGKFWRDYTPDEFMKQILDEAKQDFQSLTNKAFEKQSEPYYPLARAYLDLVQKWFEKWFGER